MLTTDLLPFTPDTGHVAATIAAKEMDGGYNYISAFQRGRQHYPVKQYRNNVITASPTDTSEVKSNTTYMQTIQAKYMHKNIKNTIMHTTVL